VNGEKGEQEEFMASHRGWSSFAAVRERFTQSEWDAGILECQKSGRAGVPPVLLVPASKHYSWPKGMHVMGMGEENLRAIGLDRFGRVSLSSLMLELERALKERRPILGVVGVVGTTELGSVDPIQEMKFELDFLRKREGVEVWFHLDAAYGGFLSHLPEFPSLAGADSITLDPHKLGYVPYSSGAFLCQDEKNYRLYSSTGPYIVSDRNTLGNYTLEGSRSATGAVATFVSMKAFQSVQGYEKLLRRTIVSKRVFEERLRDLGLEIWIPQGLDTNILCFAASGGLKKLSQVNSLTLKVYEGLKGSDQYWVSKTTLLKKSYAELIREGCRELAVEMDEDELHLIRLTLMNPFTISKESAVDHLSGFCALLQNILKQSSISS
jgi:glutamate/tyrosine decarboxylase-like PLP-dependent enzyme